MVTRIKVMMDIEESVNEIQNVLLQYELLWTLSNEVQSLLELTDKWCGDNHDKCCELHRLVCRYGESVRPLYEMLKESLNELILLADNFDSESHMLSGIRSW